MVRRCTRRVIAKEAHEIPPFLRSEADKDLGQSVEFNMRTMALPNLTRRSAWHEARHENSVGS